MKKRVTIIEVNVYDRMLPLVSGYLQAYACQDKTIEDNYEFKKYTSTINTPLNDIVQDLLEQNSDIYALSCYLWNMELMKDVYQQLIEHRPDAFILLGGPQVMNHAHEYLTASHEKMVLCNGEGEKTFAAYLKELLNDTPDLSQVRGLSFYHNGELITTIPEERIKDMDEIPSPHLSGVFEKKNYRMAIVETNRGCPYHCSFCYWGAATNDRVYKFNEERVRAELTWISENKIPFIFIGDANWGMLKRDIEFSKHITECKDKNQAPIYVFFSAAKNSHKRVAEITKEFTAAGLINQQPISMQSLNEETLELIERKNIKLAAYDELQDDLNERQIDSFIELIWPLPGETLQSFQKGIEELMNKKASVIVTYTHVLLHNTPMYHKREEYKLVTQTIKDHASEANVVVQTAEVSRDDFNKGMWFYYIVLALYNTKSIHLLSYYLQKQGIISLSQLYNDFIDYCQQHPDNFFTKYCNDSIATIDFYDITNFPMVYFQTLHSHREEFESFLYGFVSTQPWWEDTNTQVLFEIDMLNRMYLYSNTPFQQPNIPYHFTQVISAEKRQYTIDVPKEHIPLIDEFGALLKRTPLGELTRNGYTFKLNHKRSQYPFLKNKANKGDLADYCYGAIMRGAKNLPVWTATQSPNLELA